MSISAQHRHAPAVAEAVRPIHLLHPVDEGGELAHQSVDVQPVRLWAVVLEQDHRLAEEMYRAAGTAVTCTQLERARELDEPFEERAVTDVGLVHPRLPGLLRGEIAPAVEGAGALLDRRHDVECRHQLGGFSPALRSTCGTAASISAANSSALRAAVRSSAKSSGSSPPANLASSSSASRADRPSMPSVVASTEPPGATSAPRSARTRRRSTVISARESSVPCSS